MSTSTTPFTTFHQHQKSYHDAQVYTICYTYLFTPKRIYHHIYLSYILTYINPLHIYLPSTLSHGARSWLSVESPIVLSVLNVRRRLAAANRPTVRLDPVKDGSPCWNFPEEIPVKPSMKGHSLSCDYGKRNIVKIKGKLNHKKSGYGTGRCPLWSCIFTGHVS